MLYLFVEGPDDEQYFESVYGKMLREHFGDYQMLRYAQWKKGKINSFLKSIASMPNAKYLFLGDADGKELDERKSDLMSKYTSLSSDRTCVVQFEIESWYYAGIDEAVCKELGIKYNSYRTDGVSKEVFYNQLPSRADRVVVMQRILKNYSRSLAIQRNYSLCLFDQVLCSM